MKVNNFRCGHPKSEKNTVITFDKRAWKDVTRCRECRNALSARKYALFKSTGKKTTAWNTFTIRALNEQKEVSLS